MLFKRTSIILEENNHLDCNEDYDYVNLETMSKDKHRELLTRDIRDGFDMLGLDENGVQTPSTPTPMDPSDKQLLAFYAAQVITHGTHLTHAIDAFLQTVEHNQPPKVNTISSANLYSLQILLRIPSISNS